MTYDFNNRYKNTYISSLRGYQRLPSAKRDRPGPDFFQDN